MSIKITIESSGDLPPAIKEKYNITTIPLTIVVNGKEFTDGVNITPKELCDFVETKGSSTSTAAVSVGDFIDIFGEFLKTHEEIIHFTISSKISACYQNACMAAKELGEDKVHIVDTGNLSSGMGYLALDAAILAEQGLPAIEIADRLRGLTPKIRTFFVLDTLKYMAKGGRCSSVMALGANLLKLKPCIELSDGAMGVGKKYRGTIKASLESCIDDHLAADKGKVDLRRAFVTYSPDTAEDVVQMAVGRAEAFGFEEILTCDAGCTVTNHCGPSTLGLIYLMK